VSTHKRTACTRIASSANNSERGCKWEVCVQSAEEPMFVVVQPPRFIARNAEDSKFVEEIEGTMLRKTDVKW